MLGYVVRPWLSEAVSGTVPLGPGVSERIGFRFGRFHETKPRHRNRGSHVDGVELACSLVAPRTEVEEPVEGRGVPIDVFFDRHENRCPRKILVTAPHAGEAVLPERVERFLPARPERSLGGGQRHGVTQRRQLGQQVDSGSELPRLDGARGGEIVDHDVEVHPVGPRNPAIAAEGPGFLVLGPDSCRAAQHHGYANSLAGDFHLQASLVDDWRGAFNKPHRRQLLPRNPRRCSLRRPG